VPSLADVCDRLPSLYRPAHDDRGFLVQLLRAAVRELEAMDRDAGDVMYTHWLPYADSALYSRWFLADRLARGLPPPDRSDPKDADELELFPYVRDLARLAALLTLPPWQELVSSATGAPPERETAEAYRLRIRRIVRLYRNGLGTTDAVRAIVEAQLPVDFEVPPEQRDRGFSLEEFAPVTASAVDVTVRGIPADVVWPLTRFEVENAALSPAALTILVHGVEPEEGVIDPTKDPVVELFAAGGQRVRVGIAFRGIVPPGRSLRLQPATSSWLGLEDGLARARSGADGDPTAPGPWEPVEQVPQGVPAAVLQTRDRAVWAATDTGLHRYDGRGWEQVPGLGAVRCLTEDGDDLLAGTGDGLSRVAQHPEKLPREAVAVEGVDNAVNALLRDGTAWLLGTDAGLLRLEGDEVSPLALAGTPVHALARDRGGVIYAGTELGLIQLQPHLGHWYWYAGGDASDQVPDWQRYLPEEEGGTANFPEPDDVFLPLVRCVHRGPDASLWVGTDAGLARYVARPANGLSYTTALEAFPDLEPGAVHAIAEDERGLVWFAGERGLLRYDGRDLWQFRAEEGWVQLGRADTLYGEGPEPEERGSWRFTRTPGQWQRLQPGPGPPKWLPFEAEPRTTTEPAVRCVAWSDEVVAHLVGGEGEPEEVDPGSLAVRYKPTEERIVAGGVPTVPRLPAGSSTWRYLALEPDELVEPVRRPSWTVEGRLLPPPSRDPALPGRYDLESPPPESTFDDAVFAFRPAAGLRLEWRARRPLGVLARLRRRAEDEHIDPAVLDRVYEGLEHVRPAGVNTALAVEEEVVRGGVDG
jgi:hypothetical protein